MKETEDLIRRMAADAALPPERRLGAGLLRAILFGLAVAAAGTALLLGLRPDLGAAILSASLSAKLLSMGAIGWVALAAADRLARPGARLSELGVMVPLGLAGLAMVALCRISSPETAGAASGMDCATSIFVLAIPAMAALLLALRLGGGARPRAAGAAAGLGAAALGAVGFALHCPINDGPTVALWYGAALLAMTGVGAALGPSLLRW